MKVIGIQKLSFTNDQGVQVDMIKMHCVGAPENPQNFQGEECFIDSIFKQSNPALFLKLENLTVNVEILPLYNRRGKLADIKILSK